MADTPIALVEFPADDADRALHFWRGVLQVNLEPRSAAEGSGWQTHSGATDLGVHPRGIGPGDRVSLPYFSVADVPATCQRVVELGGSVVHSGDSIAICRDSEGSPFGIMLGSATAAGL